jgi:hypothetical protein
MIKIAYDIIISEVDKLIVKMALATTREETKHWGDVFDLYLEATGWDNDEFDVEYSKRIDEGWDNNEESSLRIIRKTAN